MGCLFLTLPDIITAIRQLYSASEIVTKLLEQLKIVAGLVGERTKAHWDKSPLGQKPTGQYPTGQKPTAKLGRVDKSPLFEKKIGLSLL